MAQMTFEQAATKFGPKIAKWLYGAWNAPALAAGASGGVAASPAASAALSASDVGLTAGAAGSSAGAGGAAGMPVGVAPWLSLAAPLIAGWQQYTKGSGRNEPMEKAREIAGAAKLLKDMMSGKAQGTGNVWAEYGISPLAWKQNPEGGPSYEADETQPWTPAALWNYMHSIGGGHKPGGGSPGAAYNDKDIDRGLANMGVDMTKLGQELGFGDNAPDWEKENYDQWFSRTTPPVEPLRYETAGEATVPVYKEPEIKQLTPEEEARRAAVTMGAGWI